MAEIFPFQGLRYNRRLIDDFSKVTTPPYDVITPAAQESYYRAHPYNVVRLDFGKIFPEDNATNNRYTRAARTFAAWQKEKILVPEEKEALYLYRQKFFFRGKERVRTNLIARLKLVPYEEEIVFPHEETFPEVRSDRLALMEACYANFSPIFALYPEPAQEVNALLRAYAESAPPEISFQDGEGVHHELWPVFEEKLVRRIQEILAPLPIYIADGHHRYETALEFCRRHGEKYNHILTNLANLYDPDLLILPAHREVRLSFFEGLKFGEEVSAFFEVEAREIAPPAAEEEVLAILEEKERQGKTFGFYAGGRTFYFLTLKDPETLFARLGGGDSPRQKLSVSILHNFLLGRVAAGGEIEEIGYTPRLAEAVADVLGGKYHFAAFLNPPSPAEMVAVSRKKEKMPPKSTYFYPKPATGLVISSLER